jgi:hypothetical protein
MTNTVEAIIKFKPPYDTDTTLGFIALATFAKETFGEGGNPEASQVEDYLGYVNTPPLKGYVRTRIGKAYGVALEYIEEQGGSPVAELIRVEWPGLGPGESLQMNPETEEMELMPDGSWPDITVEMENYDEEGNVVGTYQQAIGRIA